MTEVLDAASTDRPTPIRTLVAQEDELASGSFERDAWRDDWDKVIDEILVEWGNNPKSLEDDGLIPPTRHALSMACNMAKLLRNARILPAMRVVPNGDGGLTFQQSSGDGITCVEFEADGSAEVMFFKGSRLVVRIPLSSPDAET